VGQESKNLEALTQGFSESQQDRLCRLD
jgi:hypothetical protein